MPNKIRFIIDPDRTYVVKLDDGDEVEVSGLDHFGISPKRKRLEFKERGV